MDIREMEISETLEEFKAHFTQELWPQVGFSLL